MVNADLITDQQRRHAVHTDSERFERGRQVSQRSRPFSPFQVEASEDNTTKSSLSAKHECLLVCPSLPCYDGKTPADRLIPNT